jgi:hypothetical protein
VIDHNLSRPARWRGLLRREAFRGPAPAEHQAYATAFDRLAARAAAGERMPVTAEFLRELHRQIGCDGEYRTTGARVGPFVVTVPVAEVPGMVEQAAARVGDGVEPPVLAALRLVLELQLIHPFRDGNGRTSRLAASSVLMGAGFRSTLFTAVEEHSRTAPGRYWEAWALLRVSRPTQHEPWLRAALEMMAGSSRHAARFRTRETEMREALAAAGVPPRARDRVLLDHDLDRRRPHRAVRVLAGFPRWAHVQAGLDARERAAADRQIRRLLDEEADDRRPGP